MKLNVVSFLSVLTVFIVVVFYFAVLKIPSLHRMFYFEN